LTDAFTPTKKVAAGGAATWRRYEEVGKYVVGIENRVLVPRVRGTQAFRDPTRA
jgi:hypothetical protein